MSLSTTKYASYNRRFMEPKGNIVINLNTIKNSNKIQMAQREGEKTRSKGRKTERRQTV